MRRAVIFLSEVLVILLLAPNAKSQSKPATASQPNVARQLREENRTLREQLNRIYSIAPPATQPLELRITPFPRVTVVVPPATRPSPINPSMPNTLKLFTPDPNQLPEGWIKNEFNGEPFYLIPCKDSAQQS